MIFQSLGHPIQMQAWSDVPLALWDLSTSPGSISRRTHQSEGPKRIEPSFTTCKVKPLDQKTMQVPNIDSSQTILQCLMQSSHLTS